MRKARPPAPTTMGMEGMTLGGASTTPVLSPTGIPATAVPRLAAGGKPLRGSVRPLALPVMTAPIRCGNRTEILNAWFSPEKAAEVREAANADGVSVSHLVRNAALHEAWTRLSESCPRGGGRSEGGLHG